MGKIRTPPPHFSIEHPLFYILDILTILQVSAIKGTEGQWLKRDIVLRDPVTRATVYTSLWNEKIHLVEETDLQKMVHINNLEVHEFEGKCFTDSLF